MPSEDLVLMLLPRQRILVIVVGLSEWSAETRSVIRPGTADFAGHALVITSQRNEALGRSRNAVIETAKAYPSCSWHPAPIQTPRIEVR